MQLDEALFWDYFPMRQYFKRYFEICREGEIETLEYNIANIKGMTIYKRQAIKELSILKSNTATQKPKLLKRMVEVGSKLKRLRIA